MYFLERLTRNPVRFLDWVLRETNDQPGDQTAAVPFSIAAIVVSICIVAPMYGLVMGSYAWVSGQRGFMDQMPQMVCSAIKMPLMLLCTLLVSLPSFFVFNRIVGLKDDFPDAARAILSSLSSFSIVICSLAPITLFTYFCLAADLSSYRFAVMFNALIFGIAAASSQWILLRAYRPLIRRNSKHRIMLMIWVVVFAFVGIQAGWTMRPFIGNPLQPVGFFRDEPLTNAWVQVIHISKRLIQDMF